MIVDLTKQLSVRLKTSLQLFISHEASRGLRLYKRFGFNGISLIIETKIDVKLRVKPGKSSIETCFLIKR